MTSLHDFITKPLQKEQSTSIDALKNTIKKDKLPPKEELLARKNVSKDTNIPFTKKHMPKKLSEIESHKKEIDKIVSIITSFKKQKKKGIFLYGPSGIGKSLIPFVLAKEFDCEYIELNSSDTRNKSAIEEKLSSILKQGSLFGSNKIILIDDIDTLSGFKDRGGASAIAKLVSESTYPVFFTGLNPYDKKVSAIRSKCTLIELSSLSETQIISCVKKILSKENISFSESQLSLLAKHAKGDLRAAITDAQMLSIGRTSLDDVLLNELTQRLQHKDMLVALKQVLKGDANSALSAFDSVSEDFDKILLWLDYNMPLEYKKSSDRARAYGCLSKADVFLRRIKRRQSWRLLVYVSFLLTAGVASAKTTPYQSETLYKESTRILKLWQASMKYAKRDAIVSKIAQETHSSKKTVLRDFGFYKGFLQDTCDELDISLEDVASL